MQTRYILGSGNLLSQTVASTTSYFLPDVQGSTRALTDSSGNIVTGQTFDYSAFGDLVSTGTPNTDYLYTGQQFDTSTGLYSLRARYYDPGVGRFNSRDTWAYDFQNPMEFNRYVYAAGNPVRWSDPSGYSIGEYVGVIKDISRKAWVGARAFASNWIEGGVFAGAGYLAGVGVYAALRTAFELSTESLLESICHGHGRGGNSIVCRSTSGLGDGRTPTFDEKFRHMLAFAFDPLEFFLTVVFGGFLNVANNLMMNTMPALRREVEILQNFKEGYRSLPGITGQLSQWLMINGAVASGLQTLASSGYARFVDGNPTIPQLVPTLVTVGINAIANTSVIDTLDNRLPRGMYVGWNVFVWQLSTLFTRYGSPTNDYELIEQFISEQYNRR